MTKLDDNHTTAYMQYDPDTKIVFLWGKGESAVTIFEYVPESPNFIEFVHTF